MPASALFPNKTKLGRQKETMCV